MHDVETMFYVREVPWHGLGIRVEEAPSSDEAIRIAGLDWRVIQEPLFSESGIKIPNKFANIRETDNRVLGVVSNSYSIIQNSQAFDFVDELIGEKVRYETAGSLGNGKKVWLLAKLPSETILDDEVANYLVFSNGHDGKSSVKVSCTPIRVVCNNTLNLALSNSRRTWSITHRGNIEEKVQLARQSLNLNDVYMQRMKEYFEKIALENFNNVEVYADNIFGLNSDDSLEGIAKRNAEMLRNDFLYRYNDAPDLGNYRGTKAGVIMALTDHRSHRPALRETKYTSERYMKEAIYGDEWLNHSIKVLEAA